MGLGILNDMRNNSTLLIRRLHQYRLCLALLFFSLMSGTSSAQSTKAVYLEGLGSGIVYSINYDQRFGSEVDGLGFRAGVGFVYAQSDVIISVPVLLNYLTGTNAHHLELGLGGSFYRFPDSIIGDYDYETIFGATGNVGYRWSPPEGGFMFRVTWTPIIGNEITLILFGGIGVGYSF